MPNMTLSVPDDLHEVIRRHPEISWSAVARQAMWEYARRVQVMDELAAGSKLTEADVADLSKSLKKAINRRHRKQA